MNEKSGLKPFKARVAAANVRVVARAVRSTAEPAPKSRSGTTVRLRTCCSPTWRIPGRNRLGL